MLTYRGFTGINNVLRSDELEPNAKTGIAALVEALNVDIDLANRVRRRRGYSEESDACHKNVWEGAGFNLATVDGGDLINIDTEAVLYPSLGVSPRVWYQNLPDGRTTFSNGLINGITDGVTATLWGVPLPDSLGTADDVAGDLFPGLYQWSLTHVRNADGLEGGPVHSAPVQIDNGGIVLDGLPNLDGHSLNVYLTSHNGQNAFLAGNTTGSMFAYTGENKDLVQPCYTMGMRPMPVGTVTAFWNGRTLVAVGKALFASLPGRFELCDTRRDFKQFSGNITLIQPVDNGVYIGTENELAFLAGSQFDGLAYRRVVNGRTVLGSGVTVPGEQIALGQGVGSGTAMICIADRYLYAGLNGGSVVNLTDGRYATSAAEVCATFRLVDEIPQYIAIPQ